jgi:hypothetical protein
VKVLLRIIAAAALLALHVGSTVLAQTTSAHEQEQKGVGIVCDTLGQIRQWLPLARQLNDAVLAADRVNITAGPKSCGLAEITFRVLEKEEVPSTVGGVFFFVKIYVTSGVDPSTGAWIPVGAIQYMVMADSSVEI